MFLGITIMAKPVTGVIYYHNRTRHLNTVVSLRFGKAYANLDWQSFLTTRIIRGEVGNYLFFRALKIRLSTRKHDKQRR